MISIYKYISTTISPRVNKHFILKGTVFVTSKYPPFKREWHVRFTTVPYKPSFDQKWGRFCLFSSLGNSVLFWLFPPNGSAAENVKIPNFKFWISKELICIYLIYPWLDKAFKDAVVNRTSTLKLESHLKLRLQSL